MRWRFLVGAVMCGAGVASAANASAADTGHKTAVGTLTVASTAAPTADAADGGSVPATRAAAPVPVTRKVVQPTLVATIDLTAQRLHVSANGRAVASWPISSGASGFETPTGRFRPKWAAKMHYSKKYDDAPMPYSVFFNGGIATHGTTATGRLGSPASHGCIRLRTGNARTFYELVHAHGYGRTRIVVTGAARQTQNASRARHRTPSARRNSFSAPAAQWGTSYDQRRRSGVRYSVSQYDRVVRERMPQPRRQVFPGDRW